MCFFAVDMIDDKNKSQPQLFFVIREFLHLNALQKWISLDYQQEVLTYILDLPPSEDASHHQD